MDASAVTTLGRTMGDGTSRRRQCHEAWPQASADFCSKPACSSRCAARCIRLLTVPVASDRGRRRRRKRNRSSTGRVHPLSIFDPIAALHGRWTFRCRASSCSGCYTACFLAFCGPADDRRRRSGGTIWHDIGRTPTFGKQQTKVTM